MAKRPLSVGQKLTAVGGYAAGKAIGKANQAVASGVAKAAAAGAKAMSGSPPRNALPKADPRSARVAYTPPKPVAPKVLPHQDASTVFGSKTLGAMKQKRQSVLDALD